VPKSFIRLGLGRTRHTFFKNCILIIIGATAATTTTAAAATVTTSGQFFQFSLKPQLPTTSTTSTTH